LFLPQNESDQGDPPDPRFALEPFTFILNQWKGSLFLFLSQNSWLK